MDSSSGNDVMSMVFQENPSIGYKDSSKENKKPVRNQEKENDVNAVF